ncbi:MAG: YoaK family protein [Fusobacterium sp.]|uniref:YoaK family protein n=1 Tax=Fusobacterium sp. TaxID=68766 RepID=UPI0026DCA8AB|nr:YoaK family protein [Fusobacterium sp.]MDO4689874.1 YoaK family protein [Fusobacterium sp.]
MYKKLKNFFNNNIAFPPNERLWLFSSLVFVGGYLGGFTFSLKGKLFVNAQTGNMILLSSGIGNFDSLVIKNTFILLLVYFIALMLAEYLSKKINEKKNYIWERFLLIFSLIVTLVLGFLPENIAFEVFLYPIAFIVAMQFATFEKAHGMGMATGFCTNHLKQTATNLVRYLRTKNKEKLIFSLSHLIMIISFISGASLAFYLSSVFFNRSIWLATFLFLLIFYYFNKSIKEYKKLF